MEAGLHGANSVTLLGYQGKLIKLAGGIFNTSSHIADAKLEIIAAAAIEAKVDIQIVQSILKAKTADAGYKLLVESHFSSKVFAILEQKIRRKARSYVKKYANVDLDVKVILFNRSGEIIETSSPAN